MVELPSACLELGRTASRSWNAHRSSHASFVVNNFPLLGLVVVGVSSCAVRAHKTNPTGRVSSFAYLLFEWPKGRFFYTVVLPIRATNPTADVARPTEGSHRSFLTS